MNVQNEPRQSHCRRRLLIQIEADSSSRLQADWETPVSPLGVDFGYQPGIDSQAARRYRIKILNVHQSLTSPERLEAVTTNRERRTGPRLAR